MDIQISQKLVNLSKTVVTKIEFREKYSHGLYVSHEGDFLKGFQHSNFALYSLKLFNQWEWRKRIEPISFKSNVFALSAVKGEALCVGD